MTVSSSPWALMALFLMVSSTMVMAIPPRKAIDVPFGRNYVPTWAFDHQKQFNGGSELQLILDKYTGTFTITKALPNEPKNRLLNIMQVLMFHFKKFNLVYRKKLYFWC